MKKMVYLAILICFTLPTIGNGQSVDSIVIMNDIENLILSNRNLVAKQDFDSALLIIEEAEKIAEETFGKNSFIYGKCLNNHARTLLNSGKNSDEVESLFSRAIELYKNTSNTENTDYASLLLNAAVLYSNHHKFATALKCINASLTIRISLFGKESAQYYFALNTLGTIYFQSERYILADSIYTIVKRYREKNKEKNIAEYRNILSSLGNTSYQLGEPKKAIQYYLEALELTEKIGGRNNQLYYGTTNNIAWVYQNIGEYKKAEALYLEILKNATGFELKHITQLNLADLYRLSGKYIDSEKILSKMLKEIGALATIDSVDLAQVLNGYAVLQTVTGRLKQADQNYTLAKNIYLNKFGKTERYISILTNIGEFNLRIRNTSSAIKYLAEAYQIAEVKNKIDKYLYLRILTNLAIAYQTQGNFTLSKSILLNSLKIQDLVIENGSSNYLTTLIRLGHAYSNLNGKDSSSYYFNLALNVIDKSEWILDPRKIEVFNFIGEDLIRRGEFKKALLHYEKLVNGFQINELSLNNITVFSNYLTVLNFLNQNWENVINLSSIFSKINHELLEARTFLSSTEQYEFQNKYDYLISTIISGLSKGVIKNPELISLCLNNLLIRKSSVLENQIERQSYSNLDSISSGKFSLWIELKQQIYKSYLQHSDEVDDDKLNRMNEHVSQLEKQLAQYIPIRSEKGDSMVSKLQNRLRTNEAVLEFVRYSEEDLLNSNKLFAYGVFILTKTKVQYLRLFSEIELNKLINNGSFESPDYYLQFYSSNVENNSAYNLIWGKIAPVLEAFAIKTIYYSPVGLLHKINLEAFSRNNSISFLSDKYKFNRTLNTSSLIEKDMNIQKQSGWKVLAYGGMIYTKGSAEQFSFQANFDTSISFTSLPGTFAQIESISKICGLSNVPFKALIGDQANESSIKNLSPYDGSQYNLIHIGTHGVYFEDNVSGQDDRTRENYNSGITDPLFRTGLLFSTKRIDSIENIETTDFNDGFLSAYEASLIDLSGIQLVTLSACESGLGSIRGDEGVYGLQRGFFLSGVKNLVLSLWKVDDTITEKLMTQFYSNLILRKMNVHESLSSAQKSIRNFKNNNGVYPFRNPYFWGGFIAISR